MGNKCVNVFITKIDCFPAGSGLNGKGEEEEETEEGQVGFRPRVPPYFRYGNQW